MSRSPLSFDEQPPLPNGRSQTAWQTLLRQVNGAATKAIAHDYHQQAQGFIQALDVAEVITRTDEGMMGATLFHAWVDALERLDDESDAAARQ